MANDFFMMIKYKQDNMILFYYILLKMTLIFIPKFQKDMFKK